MTDQKLFDLQTEDDDIADFTESLEHFGFQVPVLHDRFQVCVVELQYTFKRK